MWCQHKEFAEVIRSDWNRCDDSLLGKAGRLARTLADWNKNVFGNIFRQKRRLLARLSGIQRSLGRESNPFLVDLEKKLIGDYNVIRDAEALYWKQKSRDKWLKDGDRNTKYFHLTTVIRRRRNKILGLMDEEGILHTDLKIMQGMAVSYFRDIFSTRVAEEGKYYIPPNFPIIADADLVDLSKEVTPQEIYSALFHIGKLKAPGFDGFPAMFFQENWGLCGRDIIAAVTKAFVEGLIPVGLNHTLIVLVPKTSCPQRMNLFRPISLCCTVYKIISKVIVARLRPLLCNWISPSQVSFVPGRHISDNVMIAQELLHKFKCVYGRKGYIAWKVDLSKAYDKLNWGFIKQVLTELKLPPSLTQLIMDCVSSTSFQILVNGELSETFKGSSGIRQGDPLSPYLFVLCMEKLSHIINHAVDAGIWRAVKATRFGPHISHLFFADDLILFAEASSTQAMVLKRVMDIFCSVSGQSVNFDKSMVYVSPNVEPGLAKEIGETCGSPLTDDLGMYLGMPLIHTKVGRNKYSYLIDKVHSRLASWKRNSLNMAGRLTLLQSVNSAIPVYAMQTAKLPISTCDALDKINRDFLWGDTPEKRRVHAVNWNVVCRPKSLGGLGVKRTRDMNQAMLAKVSWRMIQDDKGLWNSVYKKKYLGNSSLLQGYKKPLDCSATWTSILHGSELLQRGLRWRIGNGKLIKFWTDVWTDFGRLCEFVDDSCDVNLAESVCEFWIEGEWDVEKLSCCLPYEFVQTIHAIPIANSDTEDVLIWGQTSDGNFTVKSAYLLNFAQDNSGGYPWLKNWQLNLPPKVKIFLWTMVAGKLMTNQQRVVRHLSMDDSCPHCPGNAESVLHLLRECPKAQSLWEAFNIPPSIVSSFNLNCENWLFANLMEQKCFGSVVPWNVLFAFCCWHLWKWRCKCVFDARFNLPYDAAQVIWSCIDEWMRIAEGDRSRTIYHEEALSWIKPAAGVLKLNVDGVRGRNGVIGAGGVIRDSSGSWCGGFAVNLGHGEVLQAEAWGLYHGLQAAVGIGASLLVAETDSAVLVNLVKDMDTKVHPLGTLISNCRDLMSKFTSCSIQHIHRERNTVADVIAKFSLGMDLGFCYLDEAPAFVTSSLMDDIDSIARIRRMASFHHCNTSNAG